MGKYRDRYRTINTEKTDMFKQHIINMILFEAIDEILERLPVPPQCVCQMMAAQQSCWVCPKCGDLQRPLSNGQA